MKEKMVLEIFYENVVVFLMIGNKCVIKDIFVVILLVIGSM